MRIAPSPSRQWRCTSLYILTAINLLSWEVVIGADEIPQPAKKEKCPVCGMFIHLYPDWMCVVLFKDGTHAFFDGPKDMFKYLFNPRRYDPSKKNREVESIAVKDYYSLEFIDGKRTRYVIGSDVYGPMGRELVPFEKEDDARQFIKDHQGKSLLLFTDVTPAILKGLDND